MFYFFATPLRTAVLVPLEESLPLLWISALVPPQGKASRSTLPSPVLLGPRRSFLAGASSLSVPPTSAIRGSWRPRGALPRRACATPRAFYADADADAAAVARSRRSLGPGVSRSGTGKQLRGNREAASTRCVFSRSRRRARRRRRCRRRFPSGRNPFPPENGAAVLPVAARIVGGARFRGGKKQKGASETGNSRENRSGRDEEPSGTERFKARRGTKGRE